MRLLRWIMIAAMMVAVPCAVIAIVLAIRVSAPYQPIKYYKLSIVPDKVCTSEVTKIYVDAYVNPPVELLRVDARWEEANGPGVEEEPVAEFTGSELPVKIDRVSPLVHISPSKPGVYYLEEHLLAEGEYRGVNRTQDATARTEDTVKVVECEE